METAVRALQRAYGRHTCMCVCIFAYSGAIHVFRLVVCVTTIVVICVVWVVMGVFTPLAVNLGGLFRARFGVVLNLGVEKWLWCVCVCV